MRINVITTRTEDKFVLLLREISYIENNALNISVSTSQQNTKFIIKDFNSSDPKFPLEICDMRKINQLIDFFKHTRNYELMPTTAKSNEIITEKMSCACTFIRPQDLRVIKYGFIWFNKC